MNKVQANYWRAAGVLGEPGLPVAWLKRLGRCVAALREPKALPAEVFPVLRELGRVGFVFDGEPFTLTPEFMVAVRFGLIDTGGGFNTDNRLSTRGRKALADHMQRYPS